MTNYYDWDNDPNRRRGIPPEWYAAETEIFVDLVDRDPLAASDPYLQALFDAAFFERGPEALRQSAHMELEAYLLRRYQVDLGTSFDWESYKDWYDTYIGSR